mmetsp:Transcript_19189/g.54208  ORF Transcript_19189/g.54208 Transcript_19189/m.54208 type:complete len:429 (-) Transcript_19189:52-1338(-)
MFGAFFAVVAVAAAAEGPCDIYLAGGTPCVAAHSTVRALYGNYNGYLYQVMRSSDSTTMDIPTLAAGGFANSSAQDRFCLGTSCVIQRIYDQSPQANHLDIAPPGGAAHHRDTGCDATAEKLTVGGVPVYAAHFKPGNGYRNDKTSGVAKHDEPESMYMVTSGNHYNGACCFDYGNAEIDNNDDGAGTMEAVYFGNAKGGLNHGGAGAGPWIMADMENALWGSDVVKSNESPIKHDFVTAMVKGDTSSRNPAGPYTESMDFAQGDMPPCGSSGCVLPKDNTYLDCESMCNASAGCLGYVFAEASCSSQSGPVCWTKAAMDTPSQASCRNSRVLGAVPGHWAIKGGDAQSGKLSVYWDGKRAPGYAPMKKQGAIILGIGGDNSDGAVGTFYEGCMTQGYSTDAVDDAVQANIVAAGYKQLSAQLTQLFV